MAHERWARGSEAYTYRDNPTFEVYLASRTASREAAFFLPYLRSGMRLLDVGCGPGTITLGLAEVVAPGEVVGIDTDLPQVERARALAVQNAVTNVRFAAGDGYRLPFAENSFDAVFAHAVLSHLREPVRALMDVRRVLRPGGIVGVRDQDFGATLCAPETQWSALAIEVRQHRGTDAFVGRHHRRLLLEAGFVRAEATASTESAGSLEQTRCHAAVLKAAVHSWMQMAFAEGRAGQMNSVIAEIDAWAERPDAFFAWVYCAAVAWNSN